MNYTSTCPEMDDEDRFLLFREYEQAWRRQSQSPQEIFNGFIEDSPTLIDEFPLFIAELSAERSDLEGNIQQKLLDLRGSDYFETAIVTQLLIHPLVERLLVVDAAIGRIKTQWFDHYQDQLGILRKGKGLSKAELQPARDTSVLLVAEKVGLQLQGGGTRYRSCCPLHQEQTPSFTLFTSSNSWYCFGCHKGGDGIRLVRDVLGMSFIQAVKFIIS